MSNTKEIAKAASQRYRQRNKLRANAASKTYREKNKQKLRGRYKAAKRKAKNKWLQNNRPWKMFGDLRRNARQRGIEFSISRNDLSVPEFCPVLGIKLQFGVGKRTDSSPSVDRIDSSKGYIQGNVIVVSFRANQIKNNGTVDEHYKIAKFYEQFGAK